MSEAAQPLHEPWTEPARQAEAYAFGLWLFLASEALFFSGLFFAYTALRFLDPVSVRAAAHEANVWFGTLNTGFLLTSSLCVAVAERAQEADRGAAARLALWIGLGLGAAFLVVKGFEYAEDIREGLLPGAHFALRQRGAVLFWGFYWIATGVHAIHVTVGLALLSRLILLAHQGKLAAREASLRTSALYWHLVDVIWVVLYPLIYLVGRP